MNRSPIVVDTHFFHPERKTGAKNRGVATNIVTSTYPSPPSDTPYCFEAKESRLHRSWGVETPSAHKARGVVCALPSSLLARCRTCMVSSSARK